MCFRINADFSPIMLLAPLYSFDQDKKTDSIFSVSTIETVMEILHEEEYHLEGVVKTAQ